VTSLEVCPANYTDNEVVSMWFTWIGREYM